MNVHRFTVINIPSSVGPRAWERCFRLAAEESPVFGVQESFLRAAKQTYVRLARELNLGFAGLAHSPDPVFWDRDRYKRVHAQVVKLHDAGTSPMAKAYPGYNDARYATDVTLEDRRTGKQLGIINTHWVVGPGKHLPRVWQRWAHFQAVRGVRRLIKVHLKAGRPVWVGGDTNTVRAIRMGVPGFVWIRVLEIDKIGLGLPSGATRGESGWRLFAAPTDHKHGLTAWASWKL